MSKTYLGNVTYPQGRIDLNSSLNNIETSYAGTVAPSITQAYQTWLDTNVPITYKVRNGANSAWVELLSYTGNNASVANWFIDEDSFASNSATLVPSQQSVKSYVDNQISTNAHDPVTVTDSSEIDFTLTGQNITASLIAGSIDETKLDTSTNASLDLADSSLQPGDIGSTVQAYSTVLQNTTASFTTADETKLDFITITQAVNLNQLETDIAALANGMTYQGDWNASTGSFPGGGTAQTGAFYYVSVGGTVDSVTFSVGDNIVATTDNASTTTYAGNWSKHDQTDAVQAVAGKTGSVTLVASDITDFDTEVSNNTDVAANTSARHAAVTVTDSSEINFTLTGQNITASLINGSIDETKLDTSTNASLDLADSSLQPGDIGSTVQAYSTVLQNTTASFTTADETKLDFITVTQSVDLDTLESSSHAAVTLAGSLDYLTITGQQITRNAIDLSTDVTGSLPQSAVTDLVGDLAGKQPLDADLTAIAALAGTSGLLRKTAANTWSLDTATYLTSNQTITLTGDVTGSGTTSITTTLSNTGVGAGTYRSVTVDIKGRVTAGTNPTTLAGYGITDALSNSTSSTQSGYFGDIYLYDDSTPSHYLQITNSANLTALRTLNINVNDADRTLSLSGNLTLANNFITSGNFSLTLTTTGATNVTLPTSGTLVTTSNNLSVFATTTSAQLAGVISDETGTGSLVFANSPTFTGTVTLPSNTSIGTVSSTEISYLDGVTSNIQTQLDNAGGGGLTVTYHNTSTLNAVANTHYVLDTSLTAIGVTLPTAPTAGTVVGISDFKGDFSTNNVTINAGGSDTIGDDVETQLVLSEDYTCVELAYVNGNWSFKQLELLQSGAGGDALTTNPLSQFASTTSAQLASVISDETGTGLLVFNDTPTLIDPQITGSIKEDVYSLTGTEVSPANGSIQTKTIGSNTTLTYNAGWAEGEAVTLMITASGSFTITFPTTTWVNSGGSAPSQPASGLLVVLIWKISTTYYGALVGDGS